jgi:hypothetical protein
MVAGVNVYVTVPSLFVVGVTLLQPRKYVVPFELATLKRGEPPWHWLALARVNDPDENVWPSSPVIDAPADAFVAVAQFFSRWSTPLPNVDTTGQLEPVPTKVHGTSAAAAVLATARAATTAVRKTSRFIGASFG